MSPQPETVDTEMEETVRTLADLLLQVMPLADLVNLPTTSHEHRALLRELVGPMEYIELAAILQTMSSLRVWQLTHRDDEVQR